jgi:hypothetical protein
MVVRRMALALSVLVVVTAVLATRADAFIYWSNSDPTTGGPSIGRANTDGSAPNNAFVHTNNIPQGVAVDSDHLYWTDCKSPPDVAAVSAAHSFSTQNREQSVPDLLRFLAAAFVGRAFTAARNAGMSRDRHADSIAS